MSEVYFDIDKSVLDMLSYVYYMVLRHLCVGRVFAGRQVHGA